MCPCHLIHVSMSPPSCYYKSLHVCQAPREFTEKSESYLPLLHREAVSIPGRVQGITDVYRRDGGISNTLEMTSDFQVE